MSVIQSFISPNPNRYIDQTENSHIITFKKVMSELKENYNFENSITSTSLDILALYLKGQKILHMEAKTFCEKRLNSLMLPAIFISSICSILNFALTNISFGSIIISSLNVSNAFLMALVSYLKLDGKAEAHKISAYKYQKLESLCEFQSGCILFFDETKDQPIADTVKDIQSKVMEIKESNQFILPESIRYRFKEIFSTNVFTLVKDIQNEEIIMINRLKVIIQKMQQLINIKTENDIKFTDYEREYNALLSFQFSKKKMINEIIELRINEIERQKSNSEPIEIRINEIERQKNNSESIDYNKIREVKINSIDMKEIEKEVDDQIKDRENRIKELKELINKKIDNTQFNKDFEKLEKERLNSLEETIKYRKNYLDLSKKFDDEMRDDRIKQKRKWDICNWFKT
jgi:hypothetical protein